MNTHSLSSQRTRNAGFTIIESMVVTGIMGVVTAIALPIYQDYTARAQLTEVVAGMSAAKHSITESVTTTGSIPTDLTAPFGANSGSVTAVSVYRYENCPDRGGIEVEMGNDIDAALQGKRLRLDYQGNGQWLCGKGSGEALSDSLLPKACRNAVAAAPADCGDIEVTALAIDDTASVASNSFGDENWTAGYGTGGADEVASDATTAEAADDDALVDETLEWEPVVASTSSDFDYSASNDTVTTTAPSNGTAVSSEQGCEDSMGGAAESGSSDALLTAEADADCTV